MALTLACALASPAVAEEPEEPQPSSSTITDYSSKPKPKPPPPPPAPPTVKPPAKPTAPAAPAPAAATAPDKTPPVSGSAPPPPAAAPAPAPAAVIPPPGGVREIKVPAGQSMDALKVPGTVGTYKPGLGERILDIKIVDNTKTDALTVEYIANIKKGEILSPELVERARTNLLSVGLFKEVLVYWEPHTNGAGSGVRLIVSAKDKLSWIVAPLFAYSALNVGGGIAYAESNAFGKNKKVLLLGEYTTAEKLLFFAWLDPQIRNTPLYWRIDFLLRRDSIVEYARGHDGSPRVSRLTDLDTYGAGLMLGVNFTRRLHLDARLKIYYDNVQTPSCFNTTNFDRSGTPDVVAEQGGHCHSPGSSGWDNTLTFNFGYDSRSKVYGVLNGLLVNANYQYGATWLGTRYDYHLLELTGMYARRFFKEHNLIFKLAADIYFDPPFKHEVEVGGVGMRGYVYRQYRGDTAVRATLEYILPLFEIKGLAVRLIAFYDTNLTWFRSLPPQDGALSRFVVRGSGFRDFLPDTPSGVVRDSWHNGIGLGLRMYLKGVVLPLIGVDVAYGFESESVQVYLNLGTNLD